ncbi:MAG: hypothetical protein GC191_09065 [Azospirillum sp.]|nr:hypothetical protein [Azospirillum sp.]
MNALLVDLGAVPHHHCDHALDGLYKAMAEGDERSTWRPHESPWLTEHVEDCTARMQAILTAIQDALSRALTGQPLGALAKADPPWSRWDSAAFGAASAYLEGKAPASYTLEDWVMLVDWLIQRYLPDGVIKSEAEYLVVRAAVAGKVQTNIDAQQALRDRLTPRMVPALARLLPTRFAEAAAKLLTPVETAILRVAHARAAENISAVSEGLRHRMKGIILEHVQAIVLGQAEGTTGHLQTRLFDEFGVANRDMRRIAISEAGECMSQGQIAAAQPGQRVKRMEAYRGACPWCQSIDGQVVTVVDPAKPGKDGNAEVWLGKTNVGRSAAPRRRTEAGLVPREPHEMWWIAAGIQHPHCRGGWQAVSGKPAAVSQEFEDFLQDALKRAG